MPYAADRDYTVCPHRERAIPAAAVRRLYAVIVDTHLHAYVEDVIVHPDHRRRGVATVVLERLLAELRACRVVSLFCSTELASLYQRLGFRATRQVVMHRHAEQESGA